MTETFLIQFGLWRVEPARCTGSASSRMILGRSGSALQLV
jgi:hypothetical protein